MKHLLHIWLLLLPLSSFAQEKCFKAYNQQGQETTVLCTGQEFLFQDCGNQVPDENEYYVFDYKKGTPITNASDEQRHTYAKPGIYRVLQIANYGNATLTDTISKVFEVREVPSPVFKTRSCANGTVSVDITDSNYDSYSVDFGDGQQTPNVAPNTSVQHSYRAQETFTITVEGIYKGGGSCTGMTTASVSTLPPAPLPLIRFLTVQQQATAGQLQLALESLQPGYNYIVQQKQGNAFTTIGTIRNITQQSINHQVQNINTTESTSYLVKPLDACGTEFQSSNSVSSVALEAIVGDQQVELEWKSASFTGTFEVYRNGAVLQTLSSSSRSFTDSDVFCGQTYRYEVHGIASDGSRSLSVSREVQVTSTAAPDAPYLFATYNPGNHVELVLELPQDEASQGISLERSESGSTYQVLAQVQQVTFTDAVASPAPRCYRATYTNACGNTSSPSNASCPVFLQVRKLDNGAAFILEWTAYEGFLKGVRQYAVELLNEAGNVVSSYSASGITYTDRTLSQDLQRLRYRIRATGANGVSTYSNTAEVEQELVLHVPSGFSPNGDGLNDSFEIKARFLSSYRVRIYNNRGNVIYEGTEADSPWDGTLKGNRLPAGAYAYEITATSSTGSTKRRTGTVTLLR